MTGEVIALSIASVKPVLGNAQVLVFYALLVAWMLCQRLAAADLSELEQMLGEAVLKALELAHIPVKSACDLMRTRDGKPMDESNFRKALRGEPGFTFNLTRLMQLPIDFWVAFLPTLSYIVVRAHIVQVVEDAKSLRRLS